MEKEIKEGIRRIIQALIFHIMRRLINKDHSQTESKRDAYWDNFKATLIFLVVLGHFLLPVADRGRISQSVNHWICIFHMPAFVFVSGVFSKSYVKKDHKEDKLAGFFTLYVFFTAMPIALGAIIHRQLIIEDAVDSFFLQGSAQWYMLSMLFWYMLIPYVSLLRPVLAFPFFILVALLAGNYPECGNFLALSRTIVLFPFFLAGFHFDSGCKLSKKPGAAIAGTLFLLASAVALFLYGPQLSDLLKLIYANSSYRSLDLQRGILMRSLWYVWASGMIASLMCVIPDKRFYFTYIGERTLGIYIIHRIVRDSFNTLGIYDHLGTGAILLGECILISFVVMLFASVRPFTEFFNKAFHLKCLWKTPVEKQKP